MSEDSDAEDSEGTEDVEGEAPSIVLLDPTVDEEIVETLEAELGVTIRVEPALPLADDIPELGDIAIVVPLDLGSVSGLDVVETLRSRPNGVTLPIAIASASPTHNRLRIALRAGASTWLHQPYETAEWQQRFGTYISAATSADESAPSEADEEQDADGEESSA